MTNKDIERQFSEIFNSQVKNYENENPLNGNNFFASYRRKDEIFNYINTIAEKVKNDYSISKKYGVSQITFNEIIDISKEVSKAEWILDNGGILL